ncbi:MAG: LamG domain-containing protein, partial [Verrucomicrobiae bacterium]|nr:LamG domain-containing protein [Verrucomicrobiae bacterium]
VEDINVYLGRSQWTDPLFAGEFDEFRIYSGSLTEDQVAATYAAGPLVVPELAPPPTLAARLSAGNLEIRWSATASGFVLESSGTVGIGANWQPVSQSPQIDGNELKVVVPVTDSSRFYRLRK